MKDTAIGTKVAPTYATLVLESLEERMYETLKMEKDENFAKYIKEQWIRYLDDCFIFWESSMTDFTYFENLLNPLHAYIQFKGKKSAERFPFLGIMVIIIKHGTSIITDFYFKSTDSMQYLNFNSCHPKATKLNIPYIMINNTFIDLEFRCKEK